MGVMASRQVAECSDAHSSSSASAGAVSRGNMTAGSSIRVAARGMPGRGVDHILFQRPMEPR